MTFQEGVYVINKALDKGDAELARATVKELQQRLADDPDLAATIPVEDRRAFLETFHRPEWDADNPDAPWVTKPEDERKVPWEPLDQIKPEELPEDTPDPVRFPLPWGSCSRGNGHEDIVAHNGVIVAHVYCWDAKAYKELDSRLRDLNLGYC